MAWHSLWLWANWSTLIFALGFIWILKIYEISNSWLLLGVEMNHFGNRWSVLFHSFPFSLFLSFSLGWFGKQIGGSAKPPLILCELLSNYQAKNSKPTVRGLSQEYPICLHTCMSEISSDLCALVRLQCAEYFERLSDFFTAENDGMVRPTALGFASISERVLQKLLNNEECFWGWVYEQNAD